MIALPSLSIRAWSMIGTGLFIAALLVALFATRATLADEKREHAQALTAHSVTRGSLARVEKELARMVAEQKALANGDANRISASRQVLQMAESAARLRQAVIDRLEHSAEIMMGEPAVEHCKASDTLLGDWAA